MAQDWHHASWRRHHAFQSGTYTVACLISLSVVVQIAVDFVRGDGDLGTGITGVLGLLLASFLGYRATLRWQHYRRAKNESARSQ